jgi:hypothetical protein
MSSRWAGKLCKERCEAGATYSNALDSLVFFQKQEASSEFAGEDFETTGWQLFQQAVNGETSLTDMGEIVHAVEPTSFFCMPGRESHRRFVSRRFERPKLKSASSTPTRLPHD